MAKVFFARTAFEKVLDVNPEETNEELQVLGYSYDWADGRRLRIVLSIRERTFKMSVRRGEEFISAASGSELVAVRVLSVPHKKLKISYGPKGHLFYIHFSLDRERDPIWIEYPWDKVIDDSL